ncbi:MAG: undecaprenyl-diphosphatase UppP [Dehalococcoidales bacterium]|nr:undecaprenyl-diphosphatase UppP [Dehalococcoidales bacterium]
MLVTVIQAVILGIVQGVTEFVPISSSAHLIIVPWLFHWNEPGIAFDVALHLGTLVALLWFFQADWRKLVRAGFASINERKIGADPERRLAWLLIIGTIPGIIVGMLAESTIEELFHQPGTPHSSQAIIIMAIVIALLGVVLFVAEWKARHIRNLFSIRLKDSVLIGLAQALAIFPGVSRSGSTITAGLALGLQREVAARYSFLLAAPIVVGAGVKSLFSIYGELKAGLMVQAELVMFAAGFIAAAISGYLCIKFLLRYLQKNSTNVFVYYRWLLAVLIIIVVLVRG